MNANNESTTLLFALLIFAFGGYGLLKGSLTFGPENGDSSDDRDLSGTRARLVSLSIIAAGVALFFSLTAGLCMILVSIAAAWTLSR